MGRICAKVKVCNLGNLSKFKEPELIVDTNLGITWIRKDTVEGVCIKSEGIAIVESMGNRTGQPRFAEEKDNKF
ncbi:MAG: hypothetical protein AOA65_1021 [Candidatus Bathyarchaeota archaeon BA1]|nr:MAG: hypothetical protein AOA65_1021 [Candidatus Bathyarchaeota archaeon BA1]